MTTVAEIPLHYLKSWSTMHQNVHRDYQHTSNATLSLFVILPCVPSSLHYWGQRPSESRALYSPLSNTDKMICQIMLCSHNNDRYHTVGLLFWKANLISDMFSWLIFLGQTTRQMTLYCLSYYLDCCDSWVGLRLAADWTHDSLWSQVSWYSQSEAGRRTDSCLQPPIISWMNLKILLRI